MTLQVLWFVLGLAILLGGGEALVRGAAALARTLGLSAAVIGLTVVAFGTSAPELVVSLLAAARGQGDIAFGNVIGSNVANLGLLLGATALIAPLRVDSGILTREIPLLALVSLAALALGLDSALDVGPDRFGRGDGLVLLAFFAVFLYANARDVLREQSPDPLLAEAGEKLAAGPAPALGKALLLTLAGLGGLALGGHLVVGAAVELARALGVGEVVIGATIVAVGTSLPELVTSFAAARKGHHDLAVGNLVGSNVFNLLFILGGTAALAPVAVPRGGWIDMAVAAGLALVLLPLAATGRRISRGEGALFLAVYVGFTAWQLAR